MFKESKINRLFLVLNLALIVFSIGLFKDQTFSALDDWINSKIAPWFLNQQVEGASNVVLVKIDTKFFEQMWVTTWTFHRWYYANLLGKLQNYGVKNVAFDVFFWPLTLPKGDKAQKYFNTTVKYFNDKLIKALSGNVFPKIKGPS